ncbi:hypothetical protein EIP86_000769 [Pleurotus ostreatoroseus]|nr:hypothetical protein EIP86_000769 [Pleurotus ostreatoroseus]
MQPRYELLVTPELVSTHDPEIAEYLARTGLLANYMVTIDEDNADEEPIAKIDAEVIEAPSHFDPEALSEGCSDMSYERPLDTEMLTLKLKNAPHRRPRQYATEVVEYTPYWHPSDQQRADKEAQKQKKTMHELAIFRHMPVKRAVLEEAAQVARLKYGLDILGISPNEPDQQPEEPATVQEESMDLDDTYQVYCVQLPRILKIEEQDLNFAKILEENLALQASTKQESMSMNSQQLVFRDTRLYLQGQAYNLPSFSKLFEIKSNEPPVPDVTGPARGPRIPELDRGSAKASRAYEAPA